LTIPNVAEGTTVIAGIVIPSTSPLFLAIVGLHVAMALVCVVTGPVAMLSPKRAGRHTRFGSIYYWFLLPVFISATLLSVMRWEHNKILFVLGLAAFGSATLARAAVRSRWRSWPRFHITGMGASYVLLLIAFYVDNGKNLPVWRDLPPATYWLIPLIIGVPLIVRALRPRSIARAIAQGAIADEQRPAVERTK
jgi:hypothetical protein